jgi:O-antigen/teichoic acid export membrane protein
MRQFRVWAAVNAISTGACLLCAWAFIQPYGLLGGALAMLAAAWVTVGLGMMAVFWGLSLKR